MKLSCELFPQSAKLVNFGPNKTLSVLSIRESLIVALKIPWFGFVHWKGTEAY